MINFETAKQTAIKHIGSDCGLIEKSIREKPYGWYFYYQSRAYLETGNFLHELVGSGGFFVERESGRVLCLGSSDLLETWLANYEKGFKYDFYDLTIVNVRALETTTQLLHKLDMRYVVPEWEYGVEWRIPKLYKACEIRDLLKKLPCTFTGQSFWHRENIFDRLNETQCCKYVLNGYYTS